MTGRFLSFEGGEGTGKSTQLRLLADALRDGGLDVVTTREPGGSPGAEQIRRLLVEGEPGRWDGMTEALLHYAARRDHLRATVHPALDRGAWVLTDRFADSTLAYQGWGHGLDRAVLERLDALAIGGFRPDLTLVLDLPAIQGLARAAGRGGAEDRYERMDVTFHERLREGFLDIARREPGRCAVIDAAGDPDHVHRSVLKVVRERFGQFLASA
ncbi:MAG: dTMP kinase [Alphaproteobacteria bacterium]|nr:dTMP kinase [Alphaproteobacteria bacterium]